MPGIGRDRPPVRFLWLIRGEQQEYFRLKGIGVLEFVDEEMAEALLQLAANDSVIAQEIARLDEKVQEIEPPGLGLQGLVGLNRRLQSVMQEGSEIRIARLNESIEIGLGLVSKREDFIA